MFKKLKNWWKERKERRQKENDAVLRAVSVNLNRKIEEMDSEDRDDKNTPMDSRIKYLHALCRSASCPEIVRYDDTIYSTEIPYDILTRCNIVAKDSGISNIHFTTEKISYNINNALKDLITYKNNDGIFRCRFEKFSDVTTGEREARFTTSISIPVFPFTTLEEASETSECNDEWFVVTMSLTILMSYKILNLDNDDVIQDILLMVTSALFKRSLSCSVAKQYEVKFIPDIIPTTFKKNTHDYTSREGLTYDRIVFTNEDVEVSSMINHTEENGILKTIKFK